MSVDSGLPDFRSKKGFWNQYPILKNLNYSFYDIASPDIFFNNPQLGWAFYGHRLNLYKNKSPHIGYNHLLSIAESKKLKYFVYTSNADGHFYKANYNNERIEECHGSINYLQCSKRCNTNTWSADNIDISINPKTFEATSIPLCQSCGAVARPNILMFGDGYWVRDRNSKQNEQFYRWLNQFEKGQNKLLIIEIGAGTPVFSVATP